MAALPLAQAPVLALVRVEAPEQVQGQGVRLEAVKAQRRLHLLELVHERWLAPWAMC